MKYEQKISSVSGGHIIEQNFSLASGHFPFIPGGYPAICAEYHRKRNETNFLLVLYIRTPSEQGLTPKNTHWPKPGQAYFRENASLGWHYPTLTCDIQVIPKVRKRRYWNTPCFTIHIHRAQSPMLWPLIARPWDQA
jgi:hypothetical protein